MGSVTSTSITYQASAPVIKRPNTVAVGTIVWLGSEVMFFAGLFAIYFTLRSTSPELWEFEADRLNFPFALTNTIILVLSSFTCQFGVFAAERLQPYATGGVYVNHIGLEEEDGADQGWAAYGANYQRLAELKRKYDPTNLFRHNQNIKPAE